MSKQPAMQQSQSKATNWFFWLVTLVLIVVAVAGNWLLAEQFSAPIRAVGVIIIVLVALFMWLRTNLGAAAWKLAKEARVEMRKVVWPTRQETLQTTLMVIVIVALLALILWGVDSVFALIISNIIL